MGYFPDLTHNMINTDITRVCNDAKQKLKRKNFSIYSTCTLLCTCTCTCSYNVLTYTCNDVLLMTSDQWPYIMHVASFDDAAVEH